jgi:uridylate kinase
VMSGAGNILRGSEMRKAFVSDNMTAVSDVLGRTGTMQNTLMLNAALQDMGVRTQVLVAPGMKLEDRALKHEPLPYSLQNERHANLQERVVLVAGGDGKDGSTTDGAILNLAHASAVAHPEEHRVLKATRYNGVFDSDPRTNTEARRYRIISADQMLGDYDRYKAVDERSLHILRDAPDHLFLQVYADSEHTPYEVLSEGVHIGTLVLPGQIDAEFAYA